MGSAEKKEEKNPVEIELPPELLIMIFRKLRERDLSSVLAVSKKWNAAALVIPKEISKKRLKQIEIVFKNIWPSHIYPIAEGYINSSTNLVNLDIRINTIKSHIYAYLDKMSVEKKENLKSLSNQGVVFHFVSELLEMHNEERDNFEQTNYFNIDKNFTSLTSTESLNLRSKTNSSLGNLCKKFIKHNFIEKAHACLKKMQFCVGYGSANPEYAGICATFAKKGYINEAIKTVLTLPVWYQFNSFNAILTALLEKGDVKNIILFINSRVDLTEKEKINMRESASKYLCNNYLFKETYEIIDTMTDKVQDRIKLFINVLAVSNEKNTKKIIFAIDSIPINEDEKNELRKEISKKFCKECCYSQALGILESITDLSKSIQVEDFILRSYRAMQLRKAYGNAKNLG
jgi:hypothetical protein